MNGRNAASGTDLDAFLRMMKDAHELMQDAKGQTPTVTPWRAIFVMEGDNDNEQPPGQAGSPGKARDENPVTGPDIDKYEAVEPP